MESITISTNFSCSLFKVSSFMLILLSCGFLVLSNESHSKLSTPHSNTFAIFTRVSKLGFLFPFSKSHKNVVDIPIFSQNSSYLICLLFLNYLILLPRFFDKVFFIFSPPLVKKSTYSLYSLRRF